MTDAAPQAGTGRLLRWAAGHWSLVTAVGSAPSVRSAWWLAVNTTSSFSPVLFLNSSFFKTMCSNLVSKTHFLFNVVWGDGPFLAMEPWHNLS